MRRLLALVAVFLALAAPVHADEPGLPAVQLPVVVNVSMRVLNISRIQETLGEASMLIETTERWRDPGLAFNPLDKGLARYDYVEKEAEARLAGMWSPATRFENRISEPRSQSLSLSIRADGTVTLIRRVDADFRVSIDMDSFPFDRQRLSLSLTSPRYSADEVIYAMNDIDRELSTISSSLSTINWHPGSLQFVMERYYGWNARPFVRVVADAVVGRNWQFYILPIFIPYLAVMSVAIFVLWAPERLLGEKAPLTFSSLLALAALSFTYDASFPGSISMDSPVAFMISIGYFFLIFVLLVNVILVHARFPGKERYPALESTIIANVKYSLPAIFLIVCFAAIIRSMV
ncbi:neurotransmitter-gated ion-channel ligand-binding protein [Allorhizobium undicola]|uniref:neurotransmitter-gated ion-channel ligand-binding protein n=1 Tax=Allorhizobium undicola TaxID=78527 RepID=UPI003D333767